MSKRLAILTRSLMRKQAALNDRISAHMESVKSANGQPLNDKRNGHATLARWERQNDAIRKLSSDIERTEAAIEREKSAIARVESVADSQPDPIRRALESGLLTQWRRHPNTYFVAGVDKARIVLRADGRLAHRYASSIECPAQYKTFARTFNALSAEIASQAGAQ